MRHAQGGGLTPQGQASRERVRMHASDGFARDEKNGVMAKRLQVSARSVERRRRSWSERGRQALCISGPAKRPKADDSDFAELEPLLLNGAMTQGWTDERWTPSRVRMLVADHLGVSLSLRGVEELLRRHAWSCRQPTRRAVERDEAAVAGSQWNRMIRMIRWSNGSRLSVDTYDRTRSARRRLRTAGRELRLRFTGIREAVTGSSWALQA